MLISPWSKVHRSWMIWMLVRRTLLVLRLLIYFWDSFSILMFEVEVEVEVTDYYSNCCCVRWSDVYVWYFLLMNNLVFVSLVYRLSVVGRGRRCEEIKERNRREGFRCVGPTGGQTLLIFVHPKKRIILEENTSKHINNFKFEVCNPTVCTTVCTTVLDYFQYKSNQF